MTYTVKKSIVLLVFCLSFIVLGNQLVAVLGLHQKASKSPVVKKQATDAATKRRTALLKELKGHFVANKEAKLHCPKRSQEDHNVRD